MKFSAALLSIFLPAVTIVAQVYNFQYINNKNGLPQSQAYAICFDNNDYAWIGTQGGGIAIYDGVNISYITKEDGLVSNRIYDLQLIRNEMYAACKGGVSIVSSKRNVKKTIRFSDDNELARTITLFNDIVWVGSNKGLYALRSDSLVEELSYSEKQVFSFYNENNEKLWVCSSSGIWQLDNPLNRINNARGLINDDVTSVTTFKDGWLIGTYGAGLWFYDKGNKVKRFQLNKKLRNIIVLKTLKHNNSIWIATMNNGLIKLDIHDGSFIQFTVSEGLSNNHVHELVIDRWGNLWVGTSGGGVSIFNNSPFVTYNKSNGLNSNYIYSVLKDRENNLWVGTQGLGIQKLNDTLSTLIDEEVGFRSVKTKAVFEDSRGKIWLGTEGEGLGVVVKQLEKDTVIMFKKINGLTDNWIKCFSENVEKKHLYIGSSNGIYRCKVDLFGKITPGFIKLNNDLVNTRINDLAWHRSLKHLFFASDKGAGFIQSRKTILIENTVGFRSVEYSDSLIWFASIDRGVLEVRYINDSTYETNWLDKSGGLLSNNIYQLTEDYPNLWIGTEKGLSKLNVITRDIKHYGYDEGFEGVETNVNASYRDKEGQLWFGTTDGLFLLSKGQENDSLQHLPPKFNFEDIQIFYQSITETEYAEDYRKGKLVKLKHTDNHIGFSIKAHHFTYQNKIHYRWKLKGVDKNWSQPSKNNTATFSNLKPGEYSLQIQASIENRWDAAQVVFNFMIETPFWQKNWFVVSYILLAILILALLVFFFIRRQKFKSEALIEKIELEKSVLELEQKALRLQMNPHFIFNVLNSIHNLIILNDSSKARYALSKFSKLMRQVLENSREKLVSIDDEIETIQNYVQLEKLTGQVDFDFEVFIDSSIDTNELILPPLLVQPFIENAIIHGFKKIDHKGKIKLSFEIESERDLTCIIEDNGGGREAAANRKAQKTQYHKSTALQVTQERLANLNHSRNQKDFEIIDLKGENDQSIGTKVIIRINLD